MEYKKIKVQNLKCGGCANTISKSLYQVDGIENVHVDADEGMVSFSTSSDSAFDEGRVVLAQKGYPMEGESNSLGQKMKSYVSCAVGRVSQ